MRCRLLEAAGLRPHTLIVNRLVRATTESCEWCRARRRFQIRALAPLGRKIAAIEQLGLPEFPREPRGLAALARVAAAMKPLRSARSAPAIRRRVTVRLSEGKAAPPSALRAGVQMAALWRQGRRREEHLRRRIRGGCGQGRSGAARVARSRLIPRIHCETCSAAGSTRRRCSRAAGRRI